MHTPDVSSFLFYVAITVPEKDFSFEMEMGPSWYNALTKILQLRDWFMELQPCYGLLTGPFPGVPV